MAALSDVALAEAICDWQRILAPIPTDRLEECELRAVRSRTVKGLLQPQELLAAWSVIREGERDRRPAQPGAETANGASCPYCDQGWQIYAYLSASGNENTAARPCACEATPIEVRSMEPLREPQWQKRKHTAIWERAQTGYTSS